MKQRERKRERERERERQREREQERERETERAQKSSQAYDYEINRLILSTHHLDIITAEIHVRATYIHNHYNICT